MFYSLIPLILIFASLAAITAIVARKFPQIAALETENLPEVKQIKIKEEIKFKKFKRAGAVFYERLAGRLRNFARLQAGWEFIQKKFRAAVFETREKYKKTLFIEIQRRKKIKRETPKKERRAENIVITLDHLLKQGEECLATNNLAEAERKYIEAIKLNPQETEAYRGLGKVYFEMKKYRETRETLEFLLKLQPNDDRAYNRLGMAAEAEGNWKGAAKYFEEAVKLNDRLALRFFDLGRAYAALKRPAAALRNFAKALEIEPNHPKYLDQLLEVSIITGDKDLAQETYERLRLVNSENAKLVEFKQRIEEMED